MNYFASEVGLTKQTRELWAKRPAEHVYTMREFDPKPYVKPVYTKPKNYSEPTKFSKVTLDALQDFHRNRLFSIVGGMS
jgi:hypothetical protein